MARFFGMEGREILAYIEGAASDYRRGVVDMPPTPHGAREYHAPIYTDPLMKAARDLPAVRLALRMIQEAVATLRAAGYEIDIQVTPPSDLMSTQGAADIDIE
jgi:hypothetical protein